MKPLIQPGESRQFLHTVTAEDTARFESGEVHAVYSTFALARDAEWSGRLFVLEMREAHEEGIGTSITVHHISPALVGEKVLFVSTLTAVNGNTVITAYRAKVGERLIAEGIQEQKILPREKLQQVVARIDKSRSTE